MKIDIPRKWRAGIEECIVNAHIGAEHPGEVEKFCVRLSEIAPMDWLGYRTALGGAALPSGYAHVRIAVDGQDRAVAQLYANPGGRIAASDVLVAASSFGRRTIGRIEGADLPGRRMGVLDLNVVTAV